MEFLSSQKNYFFGGEGGGGGGGSVYQLRVLNLTNLEMKYQVTNIATPIIICF